MTNTIGGGGGGGGGGTHGPDWTPLNYGADGAWVTSQFLGAYRVPATPGVVGPNCLNPMVKNHFVKDFVKLKVLSSLSESYGTLFGEGDGNPEPPAKGGGGYSPPPGLGGDK